MTDRYENIRKALAMWPTPEGYALVSVDMLRTWGKLDELRECCLYPKHVTPRSAITLCDNCGCSWLDDGLNPIGCPYCKQSNMDSVRALIGEMTEYLDQQVDPELDVIAKWRDRLEATLAQQPAGRVHDLAARLVDELDGLVGESDGVSGLHLNGDVATWDELLPGGRFERLSSLDELRAALAAQQQQQQQEARND